MVFLISFMFTSGSAQRFYNLSYEKSDIQLPKSLTRDPVILAGTLTKDKITDKEKFDAIFAWVAANISIITVFILLPAAMASPMSKRC